MRAVTPASLDVSPVRVALFCQGWHEGDGWSCMSSSQWRWVDAVGARFLSCLETYVESHVTDFPVLSIKPQ